MKIDYDLVKALECVATSNGDGCDCFTECPYYQTTHAVNSQTAINLLLHHVAYTLKTEMQAQEALQRILDREPVSVTFQQISGQKT